jgi:hypothetical protein
MESKNFANSPAFGFSTNLTDYKGLTKREYFAAIAMQGLLTRVPKREGGETDLGVMESERIAEESVFMADKLIMCLNK